MARMGSKGGKGPPLSTFERAASRAMQEKESSQVETSSGDQGAINDKNAESDDTRCLRMLEGLHCDQKGNVWDTVEDNTHIAYIVDIEIPEDVESYTIGKNGAMYLPETKERVVFALTDDGKRICEERFDGYLQSTEGEEEKGEEDANNVESKSGSSNDTSTEVAIPLKDDPPSGGPVTGRFATCQIVGLIEDCLHWFEEEMIKKSPRIKFLPDSVITGLLDKDLFPDAQNPRLNHGFAQPTMFPRWAFDKSRGYGLGVAKPITGPLMTKADLHYQILYDLIHWLRNANNLGEKNGFMRQNITSGRRGKGNFQWYKEDLDKLGTLVLDKVRFNNDVYLDIKALDYPRLGNVLTTSGNDGDGDNDNDYGDTPGGDQKGASPESSQKPRPRPKAKRRKNAGAAGDLAGQGPSATLPANGLTQAGTDQAAGQGPSATLPANGPTQDGTDQAALRKEVPAALSSVEDWPAADRAKLQAARKKNLKDLDADELKLFRKYKGWPDAGTNCIDYRKENMIWAIKQSRLKAKGKPLLPRPNSQWSNYHPLDMSVPQLKRAAMDQKLSTDAKPTKQALEGALVDAMKLRGIPVPPKGAAKEDKNAVVGPDEGASIAGDDTVAPDPAENPTAQAPAVVGGAVEMVGNAIEDTGDGPQPAGTNAPVKQGKRKRAQENTDKQNEDDAEPKKKKERTGLSNQNQALVKQSDRQRRTPSAEAGPVTRSQNRGSSAQPESPTQPEQGTSNGGTTAVDLNQIVKEPEVTAEDVGEEGQEDGEEEESEESIEE